MMISQASTPSITGIRISISTTSNGSAASLSTAFLTVVDDNYVIDTKSVEYTQQSFD
jgi:hypothetical protein